MGGNGFGRHQHARLKQETAVRQRLDMEILRLGVAQADALLRIGGNIVIFHDLQRSFLFGPFKHQCRHDPTMVGFPTIVKYELNLQNRIKTKQSAGKRNWTRTHVDFMDGCDSVKTIDSIPHDPLKLNQQLERDGFTIVPNVLAVSDRQRLIDALKAVTGAGRRGLLGKPVIAQLARSLPILDLVRPHLPIEPHPVRAIYFNKSPDANWLVPWHQDLTIAVCSRADVPGFGPWSVKDGIPHVQPPVEMLKRMLTVRLHLDDCDATNGALRVLRGSHHSGLLSAERIQELRAKQSEIVCRLSAGDALLMRPLLLHASGRLQSNRQRRVLHIEYAGFSLPERLEWHEAA